MPSVPQLHFMFTHLWGGGRERLRGVQEAHLSAPGGSLGIQCPKTQPGIGALAPEQSLESSVVGKHARKGDFGFSCPAPWRTFG